MHGCVWIGVALDLLWGAAGAVAQVSMGQEPAADPDLIARAERRVDDARYIAVHAFALSDEDGDGRLDEQEWRMRSWLTYARFDADLSNSLDWKEFQNKNCGGFAESGEMHRWCVNSARQQFRLLAQNGEIGRLRIADRSMQSFRYNDLNRDRYVTRAEEQEASGVR